MASHRAYNCCLFPTVISFTRSRGGDVLPCDTSLLISASPATNTDDAIVTFADSHFSATVISHDSYPEGQWRLFPNTIGTFVDFVVLLDKMSQLDVDTICVSAKSKNVLF
jgi:hypothetical protein